MSACYGQCGFYPGGRSGVEMRDIGHSLDVLRERIPAVAGCHLCLTIDIMNDILSRKYVLSSHGAEVPAVPLVRDQRDSPRARRAVVVKRPGACSDRTELEVIPKPSNTTTLLQNAPRGSGQCFARDPPGRDLRRRIRLGRCTPGLWQHRLVLDHRVDLSGTFIAHYVGVAEIDGGFAFRQKGNALVPGGPGGRLVLSPNGALARQ